MKPMPELVRRTFNEQDMRCGGCGKDFTVKFEDKIELLGYRGFGMAGNWAIWSVSCPNCRLPVEFEASDLRSVAIDYCRACSQCGLYALLAESEREWKSFKKNKPPTFTCKKCDHKNFPKIE
jgi:hypothetical protein